MGATERRVVILSSRISEELAHPQTVRTSTHTVDGAAKNLGDWMTAFEFAAAEILRSGLRWQ